MSKDDWREVAETNTTRLANAVEELGHRLDRKDYRQFWTEVKNVSVLFKELRPTLRDERELLWRQFSEFCSRAKQEQEHDREARVRVSGQKRQLVMSKIDEAYHHARGADSGHDLRAADELLQQAQNWMKDGYSGFSVGTQYFAMDDGKMLKDDHDACWERWREVKDTVRARREEISNFNYGHFKGQACEARGLAQQFPKDAKAKVKSVQGEMKGRTMQRWQFDEIRQILDEAFQRASAAQEERHREWEQKQREWRSRMEDAKSKKQGLIDKNRDYIRNLEHQIDRCRDMMYSAKSSEHQSRVQGWIDEKTDKIRDIERFNRELEDQISEIDDRLRR